MITAIIPHYYEVRLKNLPLIVDSLRQQVNEIIIWNNDKPFDALLKDQLSLSMVKIIDSEKNMGCQGRFAAVAAISPGTTKILFHDNDLLASRRSVAHMLDLLKQFPGDIITATGEWRTYNGRVVPISRGRFELMGLLTLLKILHNWNNDSRSIHDDIWLSVQAEKLGIARRFANISWKNLRDNVGFCREPGFYEQRVEVFQKLMKEEFDADTRSSERP